MRIGYCEQLKKKKIQKLKTFYLYLMEERKTNRLKDDYFFIEVLGEGSFGRTFLVLRKRDGKKMAMKTILINNHTEEEIEIIESQISVYQQIKHPNLIAIEDFQFTPEKISIVTDYYPLNLRTVIKAKNHPEIIKRVFLFAIDGLYVLHNFSLPHLGLSPSDIFINQFFNPIISIPTFWKTGRIIPSAFHPSIENTFFLAPEYILVKNFESDLTMQAKSDTFSLGMLLLYLIDSPFFLTHLKNLNRDASILQMELYKLNEKPDLAISSDFLTILWDFLEFQPANRSEIKTIWPLLREVGLVNI